MSRAEDEEQEEERFYESLDRILSSTCSSSCTSSSAEEEDVRDSNSSPVSHNYAPDFPLPIPRFPMGVSNNYDVWISEPSSIEERRLRLLHHLGLSHDPLLSRRSSSLSSASGGSCLGDFGRSVSSDQLSNSRQNGVVSCSYSNSFIVRSKSDSSTDHRSLHDHYIPNSSLDSPHIPLVTSVSPSSIATGSQFVNKRSILLNKPPTVEKGSNGELDRDDECRIKDLDNGKEFVVNEFREDGMWDNLKEVGTGRQLTMEEFEMSVGHSPIVQELMRRQNVENLNKDDDMIDHNCENGSSDIGLRSRKKGGHWLKSIRHVASAIRRNSDERDTSSEKGGRRSSSATDDSQDCSFHGPERVRVRQYGKSCKELNGLYKNQEIQAHTGSIWTIKFSLDGKYLASAGEDCIIHVWQVVKTERKGSLLMENFEDGNLNLLLVASGSPEPTTVMSPKIEGNKKKKRRGRLSISQKSINLDPILVPETIFGLSDKPIFSFKGHLDDVLDLSWSKSKQLLSSSMDKTVRLWDLYSKSCLKIFSHSDYVTCIQFNPVDENYFISGSLDAKVRIWSVPDRRVVDWSDLHEMVTAACYTPDGQGALVGSYKGSCRLYNTSDNKLQQKTQINLQNKKKKSHHKKITGFQFVPGSSSEVLVTSSDSRIRVIDGVDFVHKFKGFRNTNSQMSASLTASGKYVVCASEDSNVYIWKQEEDQSRPTHRNKGITVARAYEHFHCQDVSVALPWPGMSDSWTLEDTCSIQHNNNSNSHHFDDMSAANHHPPTPVDGCTSSLVNGIISNASNGYFFDRISATWPEEKLYKNRHSPRVSMDFSNGFTQNNKSAWGMVIVTAGLRGEIRTYQNFGLPFGI
ncbi:WD repeat-containing protein 44-like isoform X2 [Impatiens glandulifera]|uniref:WD repeat-containing protein 44-like isoform X2 n=1 Tax=Impatiens glandulifera TaxID=253017 RepID=UPI001FB15BA9|nr:WD repeat-containing protein 44-like isoform X2 [Impatiens glandulifera]